MEINNYFNGSSSQYQVDEKSTVYRKLMNKVYMWMTLALIITAVTAYGVAKSPVLSDLVFSSMKSVILIMIAELALVFYLTARINKLSLTAATFSFIIYSILNGLTLSLIFAIYKIDVIVQTFFITAGTFATMALIGIFIKKDLSKFGKIFMMALIGLIIASVVNIFFYNSMLNLVISYGGVIIFVGLTAWDSQKIKKLLENAPDASEEVQKIALMGALTLYLDFINLFIYLLRILGFKR